MLIQGQLTKWKGNFMGRLITLSSTWFARDLRNPYQHSHLAWNHARVEHRGWAIRPKNSGLSVLGLTYPNSPIKREENLTNKIQSIQMIIGHEGDEAEEQRSRAHEYGRPDNWHGLSGHFWAS